MRYNGKNICFFPTAGRFRELLTFSRDFWTFDTNARIPAKIYLESDTKDHLSWESRCPFQNTTRGATTIIAEAHAVQEEKQKQKETRPRKTIRADTSLLTTAIVFKRTKATKSRVAMKVACQLHSKG